MRAICSTRLVAVGVQVGPAGVTDQQRVARKHEPGLVDAGAVGDQVGVVGRRVSRRGDGLQFRVAELDELAVGQRHVLELDTGSSGR